MPLILNNNPILKNPTEPFDFDNPPMSPIELFETLRDTMCKENGVGLSACQIGLPFSVFVIGDPTNKDSVIPVFNPTIVFQSNEKQISEEGCLSFPGLFVKVKRSTSIRARFANMKGDIDTATFNGYTARIFQHEYDHTQGILFTQRANRYHLEFARKQKAKLDKMRQKNMSNVRIA